MSEIVRHRDAAALTSTVAEALIERLSAVQRSGRVPHLGLTGGTIANDLYRAVAASPRRDEVEWTSVEFWWGDERFVARDSPDRNAVQAREAFLDDLGARAGRIHEMPSADDRDLDAGAQAYGNEVREFGAGSFDVLLLGLGPDGHIASLFPGYPQLHVDDQIAVAVEDSPKPPPLRISLTYAALNRSRAVWFIVSGAGKAEAVARSVAAGASVGESPASGVRGETETVWHLDEAAASAL
ncbi:6-phosphogluconolactonase [Solicola gregarius]|uniref:6-phosphogluconolactonase n=1 Tax=Solicola gregarius TaxID=2908642 RepID=A0AA46YKV7_9ACTN|nr:6-phosphogluconolactonase [Solicola gregarius]UYM04901.1 6-phosphogluconolactonase [Solicola gregarius]